MIERGFLSGSGLKHLVMATTASGAFPVRLDVA